jgi:hypothetical protein
MNYCIQEIRYFLQKDHINEAYNLLFSVRRAGATMICVRRMVSRKGHWFDEECREIRRRTRVALSKLKKKMMIRAELSIGQRGKRMKEL